MCEYYRQNYLKKKKKSGQCNVLNKKRASGMRSFKKLLNLLFWSHVLLKEYILLSSESGSQIARR